jgi:glycosyltransferase involved in cell wall biosynthesis
MFVRAAKRVSEKRDDVTFVGVGRPMMKEGLAALMRSLDVTDAVRLLPHQADVGPWLLGADVFCLTSNAEGLPNAMLEAMAAGLPVVCTSFESAEELLPSPEFGIRVALDDDAAMAESIDSLLDDEERRRRLGRKAREWVEAQFGWERLVHDMEAFYLGLVNHRKARLG